MRADRVDAHRRREPGSRRREVRNAGQQIEQGKQAIRRVIGLRRAAPGGSEAASGPISGVSIGP